MARNVRNRNFAREMIRVAALVADCERGELPGWQDAAALSAYGRQLAVTARLVEEVGWLIPRAGPPPAGTAPPFEPTRPPGRA